MDGADWAYFAFNLVTFGAFLGGVRGIRRVVNTKEVPPDPTPAAPPGEMQLRGNAILENSQNNAKKPGLTEIQMEQLQKTIQNELSITGKSPRMSLSQLLQEIKARGINGPVTFDFILTTSKQIVVSTTRLGHAGLLMLGEKVLAAGEIIITGNRALITTKSGHIMRQNPLSPSEIPVFKEIMKQRLKEVGLEVDDIRIITED